VLEHAVYVLLIEGSRVSCSHELVRHRAGFGYSQISQRYVDESHAAFVMPPAVAGDARLEENGSNRSRGAAAVRARGRRSDAALRWVTDKVQRRQDGGAKRRAACCRTLRGEDRRLGERTRVRTMLELRCGEGAELEIRRMAVRCCAPAERSGALFPISRSTPRTTRSEAARVTYHKV